MKFINISKLFKVNSRGVDNKGSKDAQVQL